MSSNISLQKEYQIIYFPPKDEKAGSSIFLITVLSLIFCIAVLPILLISYKEVNEIKAFMIGAGGAAFYLLVVHPWLLKSKGIRTEINFSPTQIHFKTDENNEKTFSISDCTFSCYENSGSDEADIAYIKIKPLNEGEFKISRQYALEGDFEALLKEMKLQLGVK